MQTLRHTSHELLAVNRRTVNVWPKGYCAITNARSSTSLVARTSMRQDGQRANNGAEVTDAPAPFIRESPSVTERTAT
jgi:hypothetical protein